MDTLYVHHAAESSVVLAILMVSFIFISLSYIFGTLLTANGSLKQLNIISFIGVVLNLTLNLFLIPSFKVVGAAMASLATQAFMAIMQTVVSVKTFKIKLRLSNGLPMVLFLVGSFAISCICWRYFDKWFTGLVTSLGISVILAFAVGLIKPKEVLALILEKSEE